MRQLLITCTLCLFFIGCGESEVSVRDSFYVNEFYESIPLIKKKMKSDKMGTRYLTDEARGYLENVTTKVDWDRLKLFIDDIRKDGVITNNEHEAFNELKDKLFLSIEREYKLKKSNNPI